MQKLPKYAQLQQVHLAPKRKDCSMINYQPVIYGILKKNSIFSLVGAFVACNSKEIGVVIIAFMTKRIKGGTI